MSHCETGHSPRPGSGRGECLDLTVGREAPPPGLDYFLMYTTIVDEIIPARCAAAASSPEKEL